MHVGKNLNAFIEHAWHNGKIAVNSAEIWVSRKTLERLGLETAAVLKLLEDFLKPEVLILRP